MLGFEGTRFNDELRHTIDEIRAGGIILFKQNIKTPEQVQLLCQACQDYAAASGLPPLIIAADQEGGTVARFRDGFTRFDGNPFINTEEDAIRFAKITARELMAVGVNMNFAPVLDVAPVNIDSIMKSRAFKGGPEIVSQLGVKIIDTLQKKGMMSVAKHFPGIGRTVLDSHFHLPNLDIDLAALERSDLIPFRGAIKADVSGMMLSHIFYPQLDPAWQASLSPVIAYNLLREKLGYDGLVMTDDLDMKAIGHEIEICIRQILLSRIDLTLICHKGPNIQRAADEIKRLLAHDPELYKAGEDSYNRILRIKKVYLD